LDESHGSSHEDAVLHTFMEYLKHRGPDGFSEYKMNIGRKWSAIFAGCVLWMQGFELTTQPVVDDKNNVLLWNGDIFSGLLVRK
jgi:asparagine synthetase B (glutamine-hydrolysing)